MGAKPDQVKVDLKILGFLGLSGTWNVSKAEQKAAWHLYVELATRISTVPLDEDHGLLREALSSLYSVFATTRSVLTVGGAELAYNKKGRMSFGVVAVTVMNVVLRPFLAKWHPTLEDYEAGRDLATSRLAHERAWPRAAEMRADLVDLQQKLTAYAQILEDAVGLNEHQSLLASSLGDD